MWSKMGWAQSSGECGRHGCCVVVLLPANGWQVDATTIYHGGGLNLQYVCPPVIQQRSVHDGLGSGDLFLDLDPETDGHRRVRGDTALVALRKPTTLCYNSSDTQPVGILH